MTEQKHCADCRNFRQHYVLAKNNKYTWVNFGHCTSKHGNGVFRKTDKICEKFEPKDTSPPIT